MKILFNNIIEDAEIIEPTANILYPGSNLAHPFLALKYKGLDKTSSIRIEFNKTYNINSFFYGLSNFKTMKVEFFQGHNVLIKTLDLTNKEIVKGSYFETIKYIKYIIVTSISDSVIEIGGLGMGLTYTMPNPLTGRDTAFNDNSKSLSSISGQTLQNYKKPLRLEIYNFYLMNDNVKAEIIDNYILVGKGRALYVDFFENANNKVKAMYCKLNKSLRIDSKRFSMEFEECN